MSSRRSYLTVLGSASIAFAGCDGRQGGSAANTTPAGGDDLESFTFESADIDEGETLPTKFTCDGADESPSLTADLPTNADTMTVVVTDPDAPGSTFTHWLIWNAPPDLPTGVPPGPSVSSLDDAKQGTNDFGDIGYGGPCPPSGDGPHTYVFEAYAVQGTLSVEAGVKRATLEDALDASESVVGKARFEATYGR